MSAWHRNHDTAGKTHAPSSAAVRIIASAVATALVFGCFTAIHRYARTGGDERADVTVRVARQNVQLLAPDLDTSTSIDAAAVQPLLDAYAQSAGVGTTYSIAVMDAQGNVIAGHEPDTAREPASTTKTLTAFAAASALDLYSTLDTQVYVTGAADAKGAATIVLKGNGDVLLGTGANDASHINGRAGIATLVQRTVTALAAQGITSVTLEYDDSLFGSKRLPDGIEQTDDDYIYEMPASSMAIDMDRQWGGVTNPNPDHIMNYPTKTDTPALNVATEFALQLAAAGVTVSNAGIRPDPKRCHDDRQRAIRPAVGSHEIHAEEFLEHAGRGIRASRRHQNRCRELPGRRSEGSDANRAGCRHQDRRAVVQGLLRPHPRHAHIRNDPR